MKNYYLLLALGAVLLIGGCKKSNTEPDFHYEYFALEEGSYVIYDVMSIVHDDGGLIQHDTTYSQLKTIWKGEYIDNEGRPARELWRYTRDSVTEPWVLQDVWTGVIDGIRAELIEENQRVVKLVFAPTLQKIWDANAYNQDEELECFYRDIHSDTSMNGISFDPTVTVEIKSKNSLIDSVHFYEVYSEDIGLVYNHKRDVHFQYNSFTGTWFLNEGTELYYDYVSSGVE